MQLQSHKVRIYPTPIVVVPAAPTYISLVWHCASLSQRVTFLAPGKHVPPSHVFVLTPSQVLGLSRDCCCL